jgi:hypothetical protein
MDIDGTICENTPNEESHLYADSLPYENAAECMQKLAAQGHTITYFTAREEKDREVNLLWLEKHGFPVHGLIMNKPRGGRYIWVDNHCPRGIGFWGGVGNVQVWNQTMFQIVNTAGLDADGVIY